MGLACQAESANRRSPGAGASVVGWRADCHRAAHSCNAVACSACKRAESKRMSGIACGSAGGHDVAGELPNDTNGGKAGTGLEAACFDKPAVCPATGMPIAAQACWSPAAKVSCSCAAARDQSDSEFIFVSMKRQGWCELPLINQTHIRSLPQVLRSGS